MKQNPCLNCKKRHPGCHSTCEEYIDWDAYNKAIRERIRLNKLMSNGYQSGRKKTSNGRHATNTNRNVSYKYGGSHK